jgi:hypothetical protein
MISADRIASALAVPLEQVEANWPAIQAALDEQGIRSDLVEIAAAATIGTEVPRFEPIEEMGGPDYLARYDGRADLGNDQPGDGALFRGRGYVQLTGRANYAAAGEALGLDLVGEPAQALEPPIAARVLAWFFASHPSREHNVATAADAQRWDLVRERVNGGANGWERFSALVEALNG